MKEASSPTLGSSSFGGDGEPGTEEPTGAHAANWPVPPWGREPTGFTSGTSVWDRGWAG